MIVDYTSYLKKLWVDADLVGIISEFLSAFPSVQFKTNGYLSNKKSAVILCDIEDVDSALKAIIDNKSKRSMQ